MNIPTDWTFETSEIATEFPRHVREQLPWYDLATGMVAHLVRSYLPKHGVFYDLGAATGNLGSVLAATIADREALYLPVDSSPAMVEAYSGPATCELADVAEMEFKAFDVAVAFLTLCFVPTDVRPEVIKRLQNAAKVGGAVIIVDKLELPGGYLSSVLHRLTIAGKVATATPAGAIIEKELSLSGIQRPLSAVPGVEVFRFGEFAGFVWGRVS